MADSASTPREYRIRWREDAMGYDVVEDTAAEADTPAAEKTKRRNRDEKRRH